MAAQTLTSSNQYAPDKTLGLTQTKTPGGGTGYVDQGGNMYYQSAPGQYSLIGNQAPQAPQVTPTPPALPSATQTSSPPIISTPGNARDTLNTIQQYVTQLAEQVKARGAGGTPTGTATGTTPGPVPVYTPPTTTPSVTQPTTPPGQQKTALVGIAPDGSNLSSVDGTQFGANPTTSQAYQNGSLVQINPNNPPAGLDPTKTYFFTDASGKNTFFGVSTDTSTGAPNVLSALSGGQTPGGLNNALSSALGTYQQGMGDLNAQLDQAHADITAKFDAIQNGTMPLTPSQQSILDATKAQWEQLRQQQLITNQNYTQATQLFEARTGELTGGTQTALGNVQNTINIGNQKIAQIDSQMALSLSNLQQSFQDNNMKNALAEYDTFTKYMSQKQTTMTDMYTSVSNSIKDLRDFAMKQAQQTIDNTLNSAKFSWQQKQDIIDNTIKQGNLTLQQQQQLETIRKDKVAEALQAEQLRQGSMELHDMPDGTVGIFDKSQGKFIGTATAGFNNGTYGGTNDKGQPVQIGNTGIPILDTNTKYTPTGVPYIDGTNLSGKEANAAQLQAAKLGIPYLGKDGANSINNLGAALNDLELMRQSQAALAPNSLLNTLTLGLSRLALTGVHWFEGATQIGPGAEDVSSYSTYRTDAVKIIQALASGGTGLRINQAEIANMIANVPSMNDTADVAAQKFATLSSLLHNNERSVVGAEAYRKANPGQAAQDLANLYRTNPDVQTKVDQLRQQGMNPDQIMQILYP